MEYDEEQVLTKYIWDNYYQLLTDLEKLGAKAVALREKETASSEHMARVLRERWGVSEQAPSVVEALKDGPDAFRRQVRDRILNEESSTVIVNRCPKCNRIVRTPKARQCLWCGHDWHE